MRVLGNQPYVKATNADMPFGATIQNETETQEGTPVVEEVLGDVLMNIYRLLELAGINPTDNQDSDATQYQVVEALKNLPNSLNDVERILSLTTTVWSTDLKLSILPNKYFFFARASDDYDSTATYTFKGSEVSPSYNFTSTGFSASDELLVIIDTAGVRAYSLNVNKSEKEITLAMGNPLSFNDTANLVYEDNGNVYTDLPSSNQLQTVIRTDSAIADLIVNDIYLIQGHILCFCISPTEGRYRFYQFPFDNLTASDEIDVSSIFGDSTDYSPYVYTDGIYLYSTNIANTVTEDFEIIKLSYNPDTAEIDVVLTVSIDPTFVKTSNACVKDGKLYTLVSGTLASFNLTTGVKTILGVYNSIVGRIFNFNGSIYFTSGEVGKKWTL